MHRQRLPTSGSFLPNLYSRMILYLGTFLKECAPPKIDQRHKGRGETPLLWSWRGDAAPPGFFPQVIRKQSGKFSCHLPRTPTKSEHGLSEQHTYLNSTLLTTAYLCQRGNRTQSTTAAQTAPCCCPYTSTISKKNILNVTPIWQENHQSVTLIWV